MSLRRTRLIRTSISRTAPGPWTVPDHLKGLACQACGRFFQDREVHGELDLATGEITCSSRLITIQRQPPTEWVHP